MNSNYKASNSYTVLTAVILTVTLSLFLAGLLYYVSSFKWWLLLYFSLICFGITFLVFRYRFKNYVDKKVSLIYKELENIDATDATSTMMVNTDMDSLIAKVKDYTANRKSEIATLNDREEYRKEFLGNVSHELKTPLFTIQGYVLTLLDGAKDKPELCTKYLERTSKGVDRLNYIIKDLDLITKLEVGDLDLKREDFDIIELINNVFELLEMKANKKNISLTLDKYYTKPFIVNADKERIRQVITNLLVNSIKYGNDDGTTELSVEELVEGKLIVRVTDNGEGIKKEFLPRLFERFYRVSKSRSREEGGSGLGLSIVKHIIEAHQEQIYVESIYGVGSEFSFTIQKSSQ